MNPHHPWFGLVRWREGYNIDEVDELVTRVRAGERLDRAQARAIRFTPVRFRQGYDIDEVDQWLAGLVGGNARSADFDINSVRFSSVKMREGYDMAEVDAFLERAADTLQGTASPDRVVTAEMVKGVQFTSVRLREGYDVNEVDKFLDTLASYLERRA